MQVCKEPKIEKGTQISLHCMLCFADKDRITDATREDEPLTVKIGAGNLIAGVESCLLGLRGRQTPVPDTLSEGVWFYRERFAADVLLESDQVIRFESPDVVGPPARSTS